MVFIETSIFTRLVRDILPDEEYMDLQAEMIRRPEIGVIIPGSGGIRKLRWRSHGRGKRGGVRIIYYWATDREQLLMLYIYPKNVRDNLSPVQLRALREAVREEYP